MSFKQKIELINKNLKKLLLKSNSYKELLPAADYSLNSPGKRIRPLLTLITTEVFSKDIKKALDPACAIELIHTYSFIHDDLPSMDNDDFRRGKKTLHKVYPEWLAILTGDFFLTYAFEVIASAKGLTEAQKVSLIQTLAKYSGGAHLIAGQVVDLFFEGKKADFKTLEFMHLNKTAALFMAAVEFGAIIANADPKEFSYLQNFAKNLGFAFQVIDDILDLQDSSDTKKNKLTSVSILGLEKAKKLAEDLSKKAFKYLNLLNKPTKPLIELTQNLLKRKI
jgi:geranylgeranyl diphosphate synthase, type II